MRSHLAGNPPEALPNTARESLRLRNLGLSQGAAPASHRPWADPLSRWLQGIDDLCLTTPPCRRLQASANRRLCVPTPRRTSYQLRQFRRRGHENAPASPLPLRQSTPRFWRNLASSRQGEAAIYHDRRAGDVASGVGRQQQRGAGRVLWHCVVVHRNRRGHLRAVDRVG